MLQLIVFDMAGTTVDEDNLVYKTIHQALERAGYSFAFEEVLRQAAGKEKMQAIKDLITPLVAKEQLEADARKVFDDFNGSLLSAYRAFPIQPQPGTEEVFRQLRERGIRVVLNTGYSREIVGLILERMNWTDHPLIDMVLTADDVDQGRPHPEMIHQAMARFGITDPSRVGKIGDSMIDIEEGLNAQCRLVAGITTGAHTEAQLRSAGPTHIFHRLSELIPALSGER